MTHPSYSEQITSVAAARVCPPQEVAGTAKTHTLAALTIALSDNQSDGIISRCLPYLRQFLTYWGPMRNKLELGSHESPDVTILLTLSRHHMSFAGPMRVTTLLHEKSNL